MEERIEIIFEDSDLMVINKPANLVTTKEREHETNTLEDYLRKNKKNDLERNGIVHRLDKGTSGLILVAKNRESLDGLKKQFKQRKVKKKYMAMICGDLPGEGEINAPVGRYKFGKFGVVVDGKPATTKFRLISKYKFNQKIYSLVEVNLITGRTHQIRVHFSYLKWPLLGDKLYGGEEIKELIRPFLHSFYIEFRHPKTNEIINFNAKIPDDLTIILDKYEKVD